MDSLKFEKIWIDSDPIADFFQIRITANNNRITMSADVYSNSDEVKEFQYGTQKILKQPFSVVMGNDDDSNIDCVKFSFRSNKRGIVAISVFMKTRNDENIDEIKNDTADFTIYTDIASIDRLSSELRRISNGKIGEKIQLNQSNEIEK